MTARNRIYLSAMSNDMNEFFFAYLRVMSYNHKLRKEVELSPDEQDEFKRLRNKLRHNVAIIDDLYKDIDS